MNPGSFRTWSIKHTRNKLPIVLIRAKSGAISSPQTNEKRSAPHHNGQLLSRDCRTCKAKVDLVAFSGSDLYRVKVDIVQVPKPRWKSICKDCSGGIDSLVELLQGRFSKGVMERICRQRSGLFPAPEEIRFSCSCPDWASMCKHIAAVLYGVGSRLDDKPELLFRLRRVDEKDLLAGAAAGLPISRKKPAAGKVLDAADPSSIFGLDLVGETESESTRPAKAASRKTVRKSRAKKATGKRKKGSRKG